MVRLLGYVREEMGGLTTLVRKKDCKGTADLKILININLLYRLRITAPLVVLHLSSRLQ
jgi:hypothetical protein